MQAMNFGALLPDVKANLPIPGQVLGKGTNITQRACVPGIEADCTSVPFTSIMVQLPYCMIHEISRNKFLQFALPRNRRGRGTEHLLGAQGRAASSRAAVSI